LSTSITGVHGNEVTTSHDKPNLGTWRLTGEWEPLKVLLLGVGNGSNLGGDDGKGWKRDSVELIEATPETGLANTLEDLGHILELMLIRAVGYNDINTKCATHILDSLSFTSTGGSSRSTTIKHTHSLGEGDIALISEGSNTKSLLGTEELIRVSEGNISDSNKGLGRLGVPRTSSVLYPVEVISILDGVFSSKSFDLTEDFSLSYMDCNESLNFSSLESIKGLIQTESGKLSHDVVDLCILLVEFLDLLSVRLLETLSDLGSPKHLETNKSDLRDISKEVILQGLLGKDIL
jgi:hypothetical protein